MTGRAGHVEETVENPETETELGADTGGLLLIDHAFLKSGRNSEFIPEIDRTLLLVQLLNEQDDPIRWVGTLPGREIEDRETRLRLVTRFRKGVRSTASLNAAAPKPEG